MKNFPKYKIHYLDVNVVQEKYLIPQSEYDNYIIPTKRMIADLEHANNGKPTKNSKYLRDLLNRKYPKDFFTDNSPLFKSIGIGVLYCNNYTHNVKIELI